METSCHPPGGRPIPEQILAKQAQRTNPPDNEVPAALSWSALLGRSGDFAVALVSASVYSTGVRLDLSVTTRQTPQTPGECDSWVALGQRLGGGGPDLLLLGVEYADGRAATNIIRVAEPEGLPGDEPLLYLRHFSGSGRSVDATFFLSPIPPAKSLAIFCAWPAGGITETRTVLDATDLTDAVGRVQVLWPAEPDPPQQPDQIDMSVVPEGGWFASLSRKIHSREGSRGDKSGRS